MTYAQNLWLFFILVFGIIIVPGMDMFFVMANGLTGGKARAIAATTGVMLGGVFHTLFGAVAVGVLHSLPGLVYNTLLLAGAAYMAWIGWTLIRSSITVSALTPASAGVANGGWRAFSQGFVTCALNPKAYMFTLAVYPQFMLPRYGPVWAQALAMGLITIVTQGAIYGGLGLAAASARDFLVGSPRITILIGRGAGVVFLAIAALTVARVALG